MASTGERSRLTQQRVCNDRSRSHVYENVTAPTTTTSRSESRKNLENAVKAQALAPAGGPSPVLVTFLLLLATAFVPGGVMWALYQTLPSALLVPLVTVLQVAGAAVVMWWSYRREPKIYTVHELADQIEQKYTVNDLQAADYQYVLARLEREGHGWVFLRALTKGSFANYGPVPFIVFGLFGAGIAEIFGLKVPAQTSGLFQQLAFWGGLVWVMLLFMLHVSRRFTSLRLDVLRELLLRHT